MHGAHPPTYLGDPSPSLSGTPSLPFLFPDAIFIAVSKVCFSFPATLPQTQVTFYHGYDALVGDYMQDVGVDLTADMQPPKDLFVEV